jgi:hypothetical protein
MTLQAKDNLMKKKEEMAFKKLIEGKQKDLE